MFGFNHFTGPLIMFSYLCSVKMIELQFIFLIEMLQTNRIPGAH